jgi:RNA recognition motif-containing protein
MARVFVGGLPDNVRERDLSDKFSSFGRISSIAIKFPPRAPPFGFIVRRPFSKGGSRFGDD